MTDPPPLMTTLDQRAADAARLFGAGTIGYCPVCARPVTPEPTMPGDAMGRVADHLAAEHDSTFRALLYIYLGRDR